MCDIEDVFWDRSEVKFQIIRLKLRDIQILLENINILALDVRGLKCKMRSPDFELYITKYDLIFLLETKLYDLHQIIVDGFTTLTC